MHVKEINRINYACLHRVWIFASLDLVKPIIIASCSCQLRNEEGTEAEMCRTVVSYSGVITGRGGSAIGHFSLSLVQSFFKVNSAQFVINGKFLVLHETS